MLNLDGQGALLSTGLGTVVDRISLHSGDPSTSGANELSGGGYGRQTVTWNAAAGGQRSSAGPLIFTVAPATTIYHFGLWSAAGPTFYGYMPLGAKTPRVGVTTAATDLVTSPGHGLVDGRQIVVFDLTASGTPTGLTEGNVYFVVSATTDTFQVADTSGGGADNLTSDSQVGFCEVVPEVFGGGGTLTISAGGLILDGRFV